MFFRKATVLECDETRTAAGIISLARNGQLRVERCAEAELPGGLTGIAEWLKHTGDALRELRRKIRPAGRVVLTLPSHLVLTKHVRIPRISKEKWTAVIRNEAQQAIPYPLCEVAWDGVVSGEVEPGQEVMLAAAKLNVVETLCVAAEAAGFMPGEILPVPVAELASFRLLRPGAPLPALVIGLGERSANLHFLETKRQRSRTVLLPRNLSAEERAARLIREITVTRLHFGATASRQIWLLEGKEKKDGLASTLTERFQVPVECLDLRRDSEILAAATTGLVGAAAVQLQLGHLKLNLLPTERRGFVEKCRRRRWLAAAAWLLVAATIPPLVQLRIEADGLLAAASAVEKELSPLRQNSSRIAEDLQNLGKSRQRLEQLGEWRGSLRQWTTLLANLQEQMWKHDAVWLENMQLLSDEGGTPLRLAITACMLESASPGPDAGRVQHLLDGLAGSPWINRIETGRIDRRQPGILRLDFTLVANQP